MKKVAVITLGCSKNLVDSERLLRKFRDAGFDAEHEPEHIEPGSIVVVNTCGFIGDAKEESINEILRFGKLLRDGHISELRVMGCLSERYRQELPTLIPEVTHWYGKTDWAAMIDDLAGDTPDYDRVITTRPRNAYLKIAEGCNRFCAFCAIPLITGRYKSRPVEEIIDEVKMLTSRGIREFNVIAQDLSSYGLDLDGGISRLAELIDRIAEVDGVDWIRLHYAYPSQFPMDILDVMARRENVCNYLDIALQHISNPVLSNMRRHIDAKATRRLLDEIRRRVPGIHIRTTLMVGFPGEGDHEFEELLDFVKEQRFERMGAFAYCEEDDTYAASHFDDDIPAELKQNRLDRLMALQQEISDEIQQSKVGKVFKVLIDGRRDNCWVGRTEFDSPEVDPEVIVDSDGKDLIEGEFYNVLITGAEPFELYGRISNDN